MNWYYLLKSCVTYPTWIGLSVEIAQKKLPLARVKDILALKVGPVKRLLDNYSLQVLWLYLHVLWDNTPVLLSLQGHQLGKHKAVIRNYSHASLQRAELEADYSCVRPSVRPPPRGSSKHMLLHHTV